MIGRMAVSALALLVVGFTQAEELRPGVWGGSDLSGFPMPTSGYQLYLMGEAHGVKANEQIFGEYLAKLYANGLRDAAIEEDAVYESDAQAYVDGRTSVVPPDLCLRANILDIIRRFNDGRAPAARVRVHLVDIDSPADAIRAHLLRIQRSAAAAIDVPAANAIQTRGLQTAEALKRLTLDQGLQQQLRTVEHSIRALQLGLEVGLGEPKGSPYLEDREQAVASNLQDLMNDATIHGVLALYGNDHVSRTRRTDGGPNRDQPLDPVALRLRKANVRAFSMVTDLLSGAWSWRGRRQEAMWSAADAHLANGETLDKVLGAGHQPAFLYIDRSRERAKLPSDDLSKYDVDAYLLIAAATPMVDACKVH